MPKRKLILLSTAIACLILFNAAAEEAELPFGAIARIKASDNPGGTRSVFSLAGDQLAVGGVKRITIWNLKTGKQTCELPEVLLRGGSARLRLIAVTSDSHDSDVSIMEVAGDLPAFYAVHSRFNYITFATNPKLFAVADADRNLTLFRSPPATPIQKYTFVGGGNVPYVMAFTPDSKLLAAAIGDDFKLIETETGKVMHEEKQLIGGGAGVFSPDGKTLAISTNSMNRKENKIYLYDIATHKVRATFDADFGSEFLAYTPDGMALVYRGQYNQEHVGEVRICDAETGARLVSLAIPGSQYSGFSLAPGGRILAAGDDKGWVYLWDIGKLVLKDDPAPVNPKTADLEALWNDLAGKNSVAAYHSIWKLADCGAPAVAFLQAKYKTTPRDQARIDKLIEALDNNAEGVRAAARKELVATGDAVIEDLRKVAEGPARPHAKAEASAILVLIEFADTPIAPKSPEEIQHVRGLLALQLSGSVVEARAALEKLAGSGAVPAERHYARQALAVASRSVELAPSLLEGTPAAAPGNAPSSTAASPAPPVRRDPEGAAVFAAKGAELAAAGKSDEARHYLLKALMQDDHSAIALYELGKLLQADGDPASGDFLTRAAAVMVNQKGIADAAGKLADIKIRLAKTSPLTAQYNTLLDGYADELIHIHQKYDDTVTSESIRSRATALNLYKTPAAAKLPPAEAPAVSSGGDAPARSSTPLSPEIERALKAAGWTTITGSFKRNADNSLEVTDGKLECANVNGTLQLWVQKGGTGSVKAFVRNDQKQFPWGFFGKYKRSSFDTGFGVIVKDKECAVYLPLNGMMGGWTGNDVFAYNDHTVPLPDGPKHLFAVSVQDSTVEISIDNKSDRKLSYKISKDGPFTIEIKGTMTIEDPKAIGQ